MNNTVTTLGVLGLGLCSALSLSAQSRDNKMNVLFIAVDDLKPNIGAYGDKIAVTPNMDRLAANGTIFRNCYVQQAISGATRASIMTGMRPDKTKVWDLITDFRQVNPNSLTIAEHFKNNGYETSARGKIYHMGSVGAGHDAPSWSKPYKTINADTYSLVKPAKGKRGPATECADVPDTEYQDGLVAADAIELMQSMSTGDKPFFLAVGFIRPHLPFVAPKRYWDMYDRSKMSVAPFQSKAANSPDVAYHTSGELKNYTDIPAFDNYSDEQLEHLPVDKQLELIHGYYAATTYTDAMVGQLLDELDRLGLSDNTVVVLWGDHGWHLGDHGLWNKHTNFEQATRACLMISSPKIKGNVAAQTMCEFVDVFPTLCQLTQIDTPKHLDGVSLVPAMNRPNTELRNYALSQYPRGKGIMGYTIRTERFRYTEWIGSGYDARLAYDPTLTVASEMYDYKNDPLETRNVVADAKYKKEQAQMNRLFREAMEREHRQYEAFAATADYHTPISTNRAKKGRVLVETKK